MKRLAPMRCRTHPALNPAQRKWPKPPRSYACLAYGWISLSPPDTPVTDNLQFEFTAFGAMPVRFANPVEVIEARTLSEVLPTLRRVQQAVDAGRYAAGYVAYEAAPALDPAMVVRPASEIPLVWFGMFDTPLAAVSGGVPPPTGLDWISGTSDSTLRRHIDSVRESIGAGDVYQVNLTKRLRARFDLEAGRVFSQLCAAQAGAYGAFLDLQGIQVLSASPELFFRIEPAASQSTQRTIVTRPMKGTHARGRWPDEDRRFARELAGSPKDRAENLMIVDLLRNDLGRIAATGTVTVDRLFDVEQYPTVLQMTSTISARLRGEIGLPEILTALFPCGSVTGAPKIAAMRRIAELETDARGIYCGTIGYMEPGGGAMFSVAIRTIVVNTETGVAEYGVGSGITYDSRPDAEIAEIKVKCTVLSAPEARPDLFETLRLHDGAYVRCAGHLARLSASAAYFGIPADPNALREALAREAERRPIGLWRVRLRLSAAGGVTSESTALDEPRSSPRTFDISADPVDRGDRLLFHKTAERGRYTARKAARSELDDVLLQNREGELTEFTTGNLVIQTADGRFTPPLDCGLLPGVFRAELLEQGDILERVLTARDLERASSVWLVNSLRGWVPMVRYRQSPTRMNGAQ